MCKVSFFTFDRPLVSTLTYNPNNKMLHSHKFSKRGYTDQKTNCKICTQREG